MRVVVLYQDASEDASVAQRDVLTQRDAVSAALSRLGREVTQVACNLDLSSARAALSTVQPDLVFNLVESLGGSDRWMSLATRMLDTLNTPYTGATTESLRWSNNKLVAKRRLLDAGLPTPTWLEAVEDNHRDEDRGGANQLSALATPARDFPAQYLIKAVWEHASADLSDDSLVAVADRMELRERLRAARRSGGRPCFAERFIEGREFNLSVLDGEVLPPAEIEFVDWDPRQPRIVGHRAKWVVESDEYQRTPRRFDFPDEDQTLLAELTEMTLACWRLFAGRGYARVDFRVDATGRPWILEYNANPCLSPDAGFAAAVERSGRSYDEAISAIIRSAQWASAEA